jgi:hypothetical protein
MKISLEEESSWSMKVDEELEWELESSGISRMSSK